MKNASSAARSLASALGFVGGAFFCSFKLLETLQNTIREFDKQAIAVQKNNKPH